MAENDIYDEEQEKWIETTKLEFTSLDNKSSIKSNFLIIKRNFNNLSKWLYRLVEYIRYLRSLIDVDNLLQLILEKIKNEKTMIPIVYTQVVNSKITYTDAATDNVYIVNRTDDFTIEITNQTDATWYVDRLMVCVKNFDGTVVYPVIKTQSNKIVINFADAISTNYNVFFI